jgi:methionyl-tRNA formyltransferase
VRTILLTSTFLRHRFVANCVAAHTQLVGVWQEHKSFQPERYATTAEDHAVIAAHFDARDRSEERFFSSHATLVAARGLHVADGPPGLINDAAQVRAMSQLEPDVLLVFGTGLLRESIIEAFAGRIINLHLGLSPYYRGAGTNFWPLVGATIHYLDAGIDTGPIIAHARPSIDATDGPHEIGNKAIVAAADAFVRAATAHMEGRVKPVPQTSPGRLYQRKDFSAEAVRRLQRNFATGMVPEYLASRPSRDRVLSLVELEPSA